MRKSYVDKNSALLGLVTRAHLCEVGRHDRRAATEDRNGNGRRPAAESGTQPGRERTKEHLQANSNVDQPPIDERRACCLIACRRRIFDCILEASIDRLFLPVFTVHQHSHLT